MLTIRPKGQGGPLLVLLHWLGGGAQTWQEVGAGLAERGVHTVALDLPGFGEAADQEAKDVPHAVNAAIAEIKKLRAHDGAQPWLLGGHSMGGKIAMIVARRALDGEAGLEGLRGMVLVSPSPPSPEPIEDSRREKHLKTFGTPTPDAGERYADAAAWVKNNTGVLPLPDAIRERAIEGVLTIHPEAFRAWFLQGSKEDWSSAVGTLALPALLFAGKEETSLGMDKQKQLTLTHLPGAKAVLLEGAKHLAPLERPGEVVEYVTEFIAELGLPLPTPEARPGARVVSLLDSERTSPQTRAAMTERLGRSETWNYEPKVFRAAEFRTVRALAQAVVPDAGLDLAGCLDRQLAANKGDGWRFAKLPPDPEAWRRGLVSLNHAARHAYKVAFVALYPDQQEDLLQQAAAGKLGQGLMGALHLGEAAQVLSAEAMKEWFEDVRAEFTRFYVADPRTMDRIGYTGFADELGFTQIALGQQEEFAR